MTVINSKLISVLGLCGILLCGAAVTRAQNAPFSGQAVISLGGSQSVQAQTEVLVPVNVDLTTLTATEVDLSTVPAALGQYRFLVYYDATQLAPQLVNGQLSGGTTSLFSTPVDVNPRQNGNRGELVFQASQLQYGTPTGMLHVADIPFLVTGEAGMTTDIHVYALDLRTTMATQAGLPLSLTGGVMMPFSIQAGQIVITPGGLLAFDSDGDGLPNAWEQANGLNADNPADATVDADGDGFNALQEYAAGTLENNAASVPPGVVSSNLSYVLFNDDFQDSQYNDRWFIASQTPQNIHTLNETTGQLVVNMQQPTTDCANLKLLSLAAVDVANGVLLSRVTLNNGGVLTLGIQQDEDIRNRVELHLDRNLNQLVLQTWSNSTASDQVIPLSAGVLDTPVGIRLLKSSGGHYRLYLNHVEVAVFTLPTLADTQLRFYYDMQSCAADTAGLDASIDYLQVLLDSDADGLANLREDPNYNAIMDAGESDSLLADDSDGDGRLDGYDNCIGVANPDQLDTDGDGFGQLCDGDLNNDGRTNTLDLNLYKLAHRTVAGDSNYNVDADFNGDGRINTLDLNIYRQLHRLPPGPSCCDAE